MDTYVLVSREVSEGSEGKHVLDPSLPSSPSRDTSLSPWTPMSWFRAKLAKAAKGRMSRSFAPFVSFARHLLITMDAYVLVSREVSEGGEGENVLDPSPTSPPSRDTSSSPWTPMSWFRAKLAKEAKERMSSILRPLRLLRATAPYHHGRLSPGFARSQRRQ